MISGWNPTGAWLLTELVKLVARCIHDRLRRLVRVAGTERRLRIVLDEELDSVRCGGPNFSATRMSAMSRATQRFHDESS